MPEEQPSEEHPTNALVRMNWRSADDVPFSVANQFLIQFVTDGYLLSFGQVRPPALLTQEERQSIEEVSVQVLGSVSITPERAQALLLMLYRHLKRFSPELLAEAMAKVENE